MSTEPTPTAGEPAGSRPASAARGESASPWQQRRGAAEPSASSPRPGDAPKKPTASTQRASSPRSDAAGTGQEGRRTTRSSDTEATGERGQKKSARRRSEDGAAHDWTPFRLVIAVYGTLIIAYGVWQLLGGTGSLPGDAQAAGPTVASSYAGLAAVLCGVGAAFIGIAVKFQWANILGFVCCTVFLAGIGRILAWAFFGLPHFSMIILMVLDLVIPPCLLVWYGWINKANRIRREMAADLSQAR